MARTSSFIFGVGLMALTALARGDEPFATVNLDTAGNTWTYVVGFFDPNHELSLKSFYLPVGAPISNFRIEGDDHGWSYETDGLTYVRWFNPEPGPSANDLDSGEFMVFLLDSPEVDARQVNPTLTANTGAEFTATTFAPVPEPGTLAVLGVGALGLLRKRRRKLPREIGVPPRGR